MFKIHTALGIIRTTSTCQIQARYSKAYFQVELPLLLPCHELHELFPPPRQGQKITLALPVFSFVTIQATL